MRVETECSCGAKLSVEFEKKSYGLPTEAQVADKLLAEFRRDHKACRAPKEPS